METARWGGARPSLWSRTPYTLEDWFDPETLRRSRDYTRPKRLVRRVEWVVDTVALVAIIRLHAAPGLLRRLGIHNWVLGLLAVNAMLIVVSIAVAAPGAWWSELSYDKRWGISNG